MQTQRIDGQRTPAPPERFAVRPATRPERVGVPGALDVLIVEDDDAVRNVCADLAQSLGCHVRTADSLPAARAALTSPVDVVFLDLRLPGGTGLSFLEEVRAVYPRAYVVIMTAYATLHSLRPMLRNGAGDLLQKPFALDEITSILEAAKKRRQNFQATRALQDRLSSGIGAGRLIGTSEAMQKLYRILSKVAVSKHPVLILGERGTGKEVVARAIHANGPHAASPFIPVDCDSIDSSRLEAELFGFAGLEGSSGDRRTGVLATAGEGTIYLNEVAALEPSLQARLSRAIQTKQIQRAEPEATLPLRLRVLASSSRDLDKLVETGRFRKDLYYSLAVNKLRVPALRDREEDIPPLAEHFLQVQRREREIPFEFSDHVLQSLQSYEWAGNVAELEAMVKHACDFSSGPVVHFEDLSTQVKAYMLSTLESTPPSDRNLDPILPVTVMQSEKRAIEDALRFHKGDKLHAAKSLGIGKTTLYRKLKEYGITYNPE